MTSFKKLAKHFSAKISLASDTNLFYLQKLLGSIKEFLPMKDLYLNAAEVPGKSDIYDTGNETINSVFNDLQMLVWNTKKTLNEAGLNQSGIAGVLTKTDENIDKLDGVKFYKLLDPSASNKMSSVKKQLNDARSNFTPVSISAQSPVNKPTETPVKDNDNAVPEDATYDQPDDLESGQSIQ